MAAVRTVFRQVHSAHAAIGGMCCLLASICQFCRLLIIHILCNYMCCCAHVHLFLHPHAHATEQVQQDLPLHSLEGCDRDSISCSACRNQATFSVVDQTVHAMLCALQTSSHAHLWLLGLLNLETLCASAEDKDRQYTAGLCSAVVTDIWIVAIIVYTLLTGGQATWHRCTAVWGKY